MAATKYIPHAAAKYNNKAILQFKYHLLFNIRMCIVWMCVRLCTPQIESNSDNRLAE